MWILLFSTKIEKKKMNNNLILILLVMLGLQSCEAQSIDLATIKFPLEKSSLAKYKLTDNKLAELHYVLLKSTDPALMYFNKQSFAGQIGGKYDDLAGKNVVYFYSDDKTGKIDGYSIESYTTSESKKILKSLETLFGKPLMDRGKGTGDGSGNRYRIWESADKKNAYLLEYGLFSVNNAPKTESAKLMVIGKNANDLYIHRLGGGFMYYKDYLKAKAKKTGKYIYADFLKQMKEEGEDYYLKNDNTIK